MDWSALTHPDLGDDVRAALDALGRDRRTGLSQALGTIVNKKLAEMIHPWFSGGIHEWARVDVYAAEMREDALVLHFIADHYNYNFAQSGSDWADHYIFAGEARVVAGKRRRETFELERHIHLTEREHEEYDAGKVVDAVRAELRTRRRGGTPNPRAPEKPLAPCARADPEPARAAPAPSEPKYRCPKCHSDQVSWDLLFDAYRLKCEGCCHSRVFETYPEQESDADWLQ